MNRDKFINELNNQKEKCKSFLKESEGEQINEKGALKNSLLETSIKEFYEAFIGNIEFFCDFVSNDTKNFGDEE